MSDWKIRQQIYHQIFGEDGFSDDLKQEVIEFNDVTDVIIEKALQYPHVQTETLFYPAKSYCVAVIYALLLRKHFRQDVLTSLKDPLLLFGNDPYFVAYDNDPMTYDKILNNFPLQLLDDPTLGCENFQLTHDYFLREFLLHEETAIYAPTK